MPTKSASGAKTAYRNLPYDTYEVVEKLELKRRLQNKLNAELVTPKKIEPNHGGCLMM
jgi:hypothetical protein